MISNVREGQIEGLIDFILNFVFLLQQFNFLQLPAGLHVRIIFVRSVIISAPSAVQLSYDLGI